MARKKGSIPVYRRHKAWGRGYVHVQGRQHLFPEAFNSPESMSAYRRFVAQSAAHGGMVPEEGFDRGYTVGDLDRDYRAHLKAKDDERWGRNNMARTKLALKAAKKMFGSMSLASFSPLRLQAVRAEILRAMKLSRSEISNRIAIVRCARHKTQPGVSCASTRLFGIRFFGLGCQQSAAFRALAHLTPGDALLLPHKVAGESIEVREQAFLPHAGD